MRDEFPQEHHDGAKQRCDKYTHELSPVVYEGATLARPCADSKRLRSNRRLRTWLDRADPETQQECGEQGATRAERESCERRQRCPQPAEQDRCGKQE